MRRKPNATSVIAGLKPEQRAELEKWLLEENISYFVAAQRAKKKFGVTIHRDAFSDFYRESSRRRNLDRIVSSASHAKEVMTLFKKNPSDTFNALIGIIGQWAFEYSADGKEKPDLGELKRMMDLLIVSREDAREDAKFAFDRERWEVDIARMCFEHHKELQKISADSSLDEDARLLAIRRRLFGPILPD